MTQSIKASPVFVLHRERVLAEGVDATFDEIDLGINTSDFKKALIEVLPAGGADVSVEVRWWSDEATAFVKEHTAITKAGIGVNTPFAFSVECNSRIMLVAVTAIAAGSVKILVAGAEFTPNTY